MPDDTRLRHRSKPLPSNGPGSIEISQGEDNQTRPSGAYLDTTGLIVSIAPTAHSRPFLFGRLAALYSSSLRRRRTKDHEDEDETEGRDPPLS